jgi:hypothetical protein
LMQMNGSDTLKVVRHFMCASDVADNFDWEKRLYVASGPRSRGVRRQRKELIALPMSWLEKFLRLLQNISGSDALKDEASKTAEQIREWAYYCQLAQANNLAHFKLFVNVKNHFARIGKIVSPAVVGTKPGMMEFDDALVKRYTAELKAQSSGMSAKPGAKAATEESQSSSEGSVDFSLQMRRFQPLGLVKLHESESFDVHASVPNRVPVSKKTVVSSSSSSSSDSDKADDRAYQFRTSPSPAPIRTSSTSKAAGGTTSRTLAHVLSPNLSFSVMRSGSSTQIAARRRDLLYDGSGSDNSED